MPVSSSLQSFATAMAIVSGALFAGAQIVLPVPGSRPAGKIEDAKIGYAIDRAMPYSGIWVTKHSTTFPDGQIVKDENTRKVWRDSEGRTRQDVSWTRYTGVAATVSRIEDPVEKVRYIWWIEPGRETVVTETHFTFDGYAVTENWANPALRPTETPPGVTIVVLTPATRMNTNPNGEKLGPGYMNGVYAEGVRMVEPLPGDPSRHRIDEIWSAPDLNLVIKTYLEDGRGFVEDSELKNIDRSEPDPSVFVPPSDLPKRVAPESDPAWHESYGAN